MVRAAIPDLSQRDSHPELSRSGSVLWQQSGFLALGSSRLSPFGQREGMAGVSTNRGDCLYGEEVSRRADIYRRTPASLCEADVAPGGVCVDGILELQPPLSKRRPRQGNL